MTKKHNKSNNNNNNSDSLSKKMDKLLNKFTVVEEKLDKRMTKIENDHEFLVKKSNSFEKKQSQLSSEVLQLKSKLNEIEQEKLKCNVVVRGIIECETPEHNLTAVVVDLLRNFCEVGASGIVRTTRLGQKKSDKAKRPVLIQFIDELHKEVVLKAKKEQNLNCSMIRVKDKVVGTSKDAIYLGDHLTPFSATLYYHARMLKKEYGFKYAWSKMGRIYVRKDDSARAVLIKDLNQISAITNKNERKALSSTKNESEESSSGSDSEGSDGEDGSVEKMDEEEGVPDSPITVVPGSKRNRSLEDRKKSPTSKRPNTRSNK